MGLIWHDEIDWDDEHEDRVDRGDDAWSMSHAAGRIDAEKGFPPRTTVNGAYLEGYRSGLGD